jgi:hypothetical protein
MKFIDYYAVLGVSPNATLSEIRQSYRRLAFLCHPDITKNPASIPFMQLLNEAYSILGNPLKRAQYDFRKKYYEQEMRESASARPRPPIYNFHQIEPAPNMPAWDFNFGTFTKIGLFFGQIIYKFIYDILMMSLFLIILLIPWTLYFIVLGKLSAWIGPYLLLNSEAALPFTMICSTILAFMTIIYLRKKPGFSRIIRMVWI